MIVVLDTAWESGIHSSPRKGAYLLGGIHSIIGNIITGPPLLLVDLAVYHTSITDSGAPPAFCRRKARETYVLNCFAGDRGDCRRLSLRSPRSTFRRCVAASRTASIRRFPQNIDYASFTRATRHLARRALGIREMSSSSKPRWQRLTPILMPRGQCRGSSREMPDETRLAKKQHFRS
ncbi:hypothetical protein FKP32DRAFT_1187220 [Trametes sanguinea]|nr:hypothetical protein FKP32DRAFT_1187220 [Trametes sanguinea]